MAVYAFIPDQIRSQGLTTKSYLITSTNVAASTKQALAVKPRQEHSHLSDLHAAETVVVTVNNDM